MPLRVKIELPYDVRCLVKEHAHLGGGWVRRCSRPDLVRISVCARPNLGRDPVAVRKRDLAVGEVKAFPMVSPRKPIQYHEPINDCK
jgi:hypothetical protein